MCPKSKTAFDLFFCNWSYDCYNCFAGLLSSRGPIWDDLSVTLQSSMPPILPQIWFQPCRKSSAFHCDSCRLQWCTLLSRLTNSTSAQAYRGCEYSGTSQGRDRRATPCRGAVPVETEAQNPPKMSYQRGFFCDLSHDNGGRHPPRAKCLSFAVYPQARVAVPVFDDCYLSCFRKASTQLNSPGTSLLLERCCCSTGECALW